MSDLTVSAAPDTRRAATAQALSDAVLEWLRANNQIPENRDVVAMDFAVPFTVKWFTSSGRVARRSGTIIPPDGPDLRSLGDMMFRQSQKVRDPLYTIDRLDVDYSRTPVTRHQYIPDCVADHSAEPLDSRRCWVQFGGCYTKKDSPASVEVWAHQITTPEGTQSRVRVQLINHRTRARMAANMPPYWAHCLADDVAAAADRLQWTESVR
ncbi:MAG: hypothetical protein WCF33_04140 [Pseudonocardiaceae bacterium]